MPRYNLIFPNEIYLKVLRFSVENKMSLGKALNFILADYFKIKGEPKNENEQRM